ncbi:MAG: hypothetical protein A2010_12420 [Nitrospirae bacterium GWD2_57_9]|nr:MAG: hypothetical protein A2010_12420 [Nitrospirae bacterium GWD2_57_9]OGW48014.1 MAG: hypothetical protein A2078_05440 [Nitrospirae bacterium GWC2_57_9]
MKYVRDRIRGIFKLNDSPNRLAYAFAVGVFIAFTPTIGLHTVSCFLFAWMFRLSKLVVFTGAFVNNPWTIVPMYGFCLWFGTKITGGDGAVPSIAWNELSFRNAYGILAPYLWPFVAGSVVVGLIAAVAAYAVMYYAIIRYRRSEDRKQAVPAVDGSL